MPRLMNFTCNAHSIGQDETYKGWGEGAMRPAKTKSYANVSTLSPALPRQGGERSEGAELNPLAA